MNAYTTTGYARIQPRDLEAVMDAYPLAAASLAALERQRGWQAETEVAWLLKQHGVTPQVPTAFVALLRQRVGAALVRVGERLAGDPRRGLSRDATPAETAA